ncbi:MAG: DNA gyrase subunit A [SAR202 cluster bacterium]|jgi:DNA gyrase subunit A|nr:MAG: DNA gyrase subunit A [SAR202 cluster bacterium]KAA1304144.1 MAG: DNA gyrase subunit A [SAR202 cluster bacterium]MEC8986330.1 DNA gyrase subunit A [Chloroflexota bacterium]MEC9366681.1 DNA gyrase subunit A [Chloroflexota bacterium]MEE3345269.1 DNA gyrase subunit A [Chloroflexota bacterium]|tara:strand:- start:1762 stop:4293 length:2532 start_codon:yes stop_codon:yes gene_type:complete
MTSSKSEFGFIKPTSIVEEMRSSYLDYAMSVIVSRALPDARDGLKPVQRRILYAMQDLGMRPGSGYKKSARLVGEVLGKWHPHGDLAVYEAMVRLAQDFTVRMPLVDGQGNFGSIDNDPPAAMRYTEARLSPVSEVMLANLDQETVDWSLNFDDTLREPVVLPARLPNLLVNGASGIAVGMATNIPPHNLREVCNAVNALIDNPDATSEDLMKYVRAPDFPTGGTIMGTSGAREAYTTGKGQIVVRAVAEVEEMPRNASRMQIVVTELPYQVNKAALVEKIATLTKNRRIEGVSEVRDESDRDGMRIVIELRGGVQPQVVLNNLYKQTPLQSSFSANMLALIDDIPRVITLKIALQQYIKFRQQVVRRRSEFELKKAEERAHILAGLRIAISNLDEVIKLIRNSQDVENARTGLMSTFDLDQPQAQAILDMQLRRLAALEREKLEQEYQELQETIRGLQELLGDEGKILGVVKEETEEVKSKYGDKRRTTISHDAYDLSREELEAHEQIVITLSQGGYLKRIQSNTFRRQHRGGRGVSGMNTRDDDPVKELMVVDSHDKLMFFTNKGRVLSKIGYELRADQSRNTRGVPVANIINVWDTESISALISVGKKQYEEYEYLVLGTKQGRVKRINLDDVEHIRPSGLIIMNLKGDDELVSVKLAKSKDDIIFISEQGMGIRFSVDDLPIRRRTAGGVKGMSLRTGDRVVSMDVGNDESKLLVVSKLGRGKVNPLSEYRRQGRGGLGLRAFKITKNTGLIADAQIVDETNEVYLVSEKAQVMRTDLSEIRSLTGRITQGVTIFKPRSGDSVSSIACVGDFEIEDEEEDSKDAKSKPSKNGKKPKSKK